MPWGGIPTPQLKTCGLGSRYFLFCFVFKLVCFDLHRDSRVGTFIVLSSLDSYLFSMP